MWLNNLKQLKEESGLTTKQIAERAKLPERTVSHIFSGNTNAPRMDTLRAIVYALGGSMDDLLAEADFRIPTPELEALKKEKASLLATIEEMATTEAQLKAEIAALKDKVTNLEIDNDRLRLSLAYKEEIISIHNYYNKIKPYNE